jgi:prepilin-type N-terminal cleavage/methylation domain-containing protein
MNFNYKHGFTLIELSIVIVIIGLIVAGVVSGQSLITQAKLRSVASEYNKYDSATNTFYLEYNALQGDMSNAWEFFSLVVLAKHSLIQLITAKVMEINV